MNEQQQQEKFESWAVVELFGHNQIAGKVSEQSIAGASMLRVDVPEQPPLPEGRDQYGYKAYSARPGVPAYTRYFSAGAIYALNPCSEDAARRMAQQLRAKPPIPFDLPAVVQSIAIAAPSVEPVWKPGDTDRRAGERRGDAPDYDMLWSGPEDRRETTDRRAATFHACQYCGNVVSVGTYDPDEHVTHCPTRSADS